MMKTNHNLSGKSENLSIKHKLKNKLPKQEKVVILQNYNKKPKDKTNKKNNKKRMYNTKFPKPRI